MREWASLALMGLAAFMFAGGIWVAITGAIVAGIVLVILARVVFWFAEKLEPRNKPDE